MYPPAFILLLSCFYFFLLFRLKGPEPKCAIMKAAPSMEWFFMKYIYCICACAGDASGTPLLAA